MRATQHSRERMLSVRPAQVCVLGGAGVGSLCSKVHSFTSGPLGGAPYRARHCVLGGAVATLAEVAFKCADTDTMLRHRQIRWVCKGYPSFLYSRMAGVSAQRSNSSKVARQLQCRRLTWQRREFSRNEAAKVRQDMVALAPGLWLGELFHAAAGKVYGLQRKVPLNCV